MKNKFKNLGKNGNFGQFGGRYVPEELEGVLKELEASYLQTKKDKKFLKELGGLYKNYVGRPSMLYFAQNLTEYANGAKIYLKREDLNHTGAHKLNNAVGQILLAKKMGKKKLIAETGAGQHGVAVATVAAKFGMKCDIYMGSRDIKNQNMNVYRMKLLGVNLVEVKQGQATLKDAVDAALVAFVKDPEAYYLLGSAVGPHPYPLMVRDFQKVIGEEIRKQIMRTEDKLPDYLVACVGGGSNAMGMFYDFLDDENLELIAVEPAGLGSKTKRHGLALQKGKTGIIHGFKCKVLQSKTGEILESYSAASGLDYPGVGPEISNLVEKGRVKCVGISDKQAVEAFVLLSKIEGIIPALESAHAIAYAVDLAKTLAKDKIIVVNLSGRGDKDVKSVFENYVLQ